MRMTSSVGRVFWALASIAEAMSEAGWACQFNPSGLFAQSRPKMAVLIFATTMSVGDNVAQAAWWRSLVVYVNLDALFRRETLGNVT
jgi:hypothetical protein